MRFISKGLGDIGLRTEHLTPPTTSTEARDRWRAFWGAPKWATRAVCAKEQYWLCAYSEEALESDILGMHLDHVAPKSAFPHLTFDHSNIVLSAIDDAGSRKLQRKDVFGGHAKGNAHDPKFISPLMPGFNHFFFYSSDGTVVPAHGLLPKDVDRAKCTISTLRLNSPVLVARRRDWILAVEGTIDDLLHDHAALRRFCETLCCPHDGRLERFHSASRQRFGAMARTLLAARFPELL